MPKPAGCSTVAQHLTRHALPVSQIQRLTDELADHWEDLRAEASSRGLPTAEAEREADQRLGEPAILAANIVHGLRRRSWLGRHPIIGVCLVPLFLPLLLMFLFLGPLAWLENSIHFTRWANNGQPLNSQLIAASAQVVHYAAVVISLAWLNWRAWSRGLGMRWIVALSVWCALMALVRDFDADPLQREITFRVRFPLALEIQTLVFLLIHALPLLFFTFYRPTMKRAAETL